MLSSALIPAQAQQRLPRPINLRVNGDTLSWDAVTNASGYHVRWRAPNRRAWRLAPVSPGMTSYRFVELDYDVDYTVEVRALAAAVEGYRASRWKQLPDAVRLSAPTVTATATASPTATAPPSPTATPIPTATKVRLATLPRPRGFYNTEGSTFVWNQLNGASAYEISWRQPGKRWRKKIIGKSQLFYTIRGLKPAVEYEVKLRGLADGLVFKRTGRWTGILTLILESSATATNTPTDTPTNTPTNTPTDTPTNTPTDTPTNTPTDTPTNTPTDTPTNTPTDTPTNTPTDTPTPSPTPTDTLTPTLAPPPMPTGLVITGVTGRSLDLDWDRTPRADSYELKINNSVWFDNGDAIGNGFQGLKSGTTYTLSVRARNRAGVSPPASIDGRTLPPTDTPVPTDTPTDTPTFTPTNMPTPTDTPTPTNTPTFTPTNTPVPTDTLVPTDTPTATATPTATNTPVPPTPKPRDRDRNNECRTRTETRLHTKGEECTCRGLPGVCYYDRKCSRKVRVSGECPNFRETCGNNWEYTSCDQYHTPVPQ